MEMYIVFFLAVKMSDVHNERTCSDHLHVHHILIAVCLCFEFIVLNWGLFWSHPFLLLGHLAVSGDILACYNLGCYWHFWHLVGRDQRYCCTCIVHRTAAHAKNCPAQNVSKGHD